MAYRQNIMTQTTISILLIIHLTSEYSDGFEPVNPTRRAGQSEIESQRF
jgi:hypothetical protein